MLICFSSNISKPCFCCFIAAVSNLCKYIF